MTDGGQMDEFAAKPGDYAVYFIQCNGDDGPVKIGRTKNSPLTRMAELQTGMPYGLRVLACLIGVDGQTETDLHRRFAHLNIRGEWFRPEPDLIGFIARHTSPWNEKTAEMVARSSILKHRASGNAISASRVAVSHRHNPLPRTVEEMARIICREDRPVYGED